MNERTLSDVAYDLAGSNELAPCEVDGALLQAGYDPSDAQERLRFLELIEVQRHHSTANVLARYAFAADARAMLGVDAAIEDVIVLAIELEKQCQV